MIPRASQAYAANGSKQGRYNCKTAPDLNVPMAEYFYTVFMFSLTTKRYTWAITRWLTTSWRCAVTGARSTIRMIARCVEYKWIRRTMPLFQKYGPSGFTVG